MLLALFIIYVIACVLGDEPVSYESDSRDDSGIGVGTALAITGLLVADSIDKGSHIYFTDGDVII